MKKKYNFIGIEANLKSLKLRRGCHEGDLVILNDTQETYLYQDGKWDKITFKNNGEGITLNLYELNQNIMSQLPDYNDDQISNFQKKISDFDNKYSNNNFFMLLCNELHYYTVLLRDNFIYSNLSQTITDLVDEMGKKIVMDESLDDHIEIWLRDKDNTNVFLLFPYDQGVVKFGA